MLKIAGKHVGAQDDYCNNNFVNPNENNNSLLINSVKCACQLCPTHSQMQNKNGIFYLQLIAYNVFI